MRSLVRPMPALATLALAVSACTVSIEGPGGTASPAPDRAATASGEASREPSGEPTSRTIGVGPAAPTTIEPSPDDAGPADSGDGAGPEIDRSTWQARADQVSCASGIVRVEAPARTIEITDDCASVVLTADAVGSVVLAQHVTGLRIEPSAATVLVTSVEAVTFTAGSVGNTVVWETGSPEITDQGTVNTHSSVADSDR